LTIRAVKTDQTNALLEHHWLLTPARMAEHLTRGRFKKFSHIQFLDRKIAQAINLGGARIIISMPPRHGKSWLTSLYTPAWFLSMWPDRNVILASYEATFAATWGRHVRNFLQEHQGTIGVRLAEDSQAADHWNTIKGGGMVTAGIGGPITGRGGDLLIIDDPIKNFEEASSELIRQKQIDWFNSTLFTRAEPGASIIILMTRWHELDLAGHLLNSHHDRWEELRLPAFAEENDLLGRKPGDALCPERYDVNALNEIQQNIGSRMFNALYQQRPAPEQGNLLRRDWFKFYSVLPDRFDEIIQSWDLSFKDTKHSDFTVGQVWGRVGSTKYLIDQIRERMDFTKAIQAIKHLSLKHPKAALKLVEEKANGAAVINTLKNEISGIVAVNPTSSKISRVNAISPQLEAGNIYLPEPKIHGWVKDFIEECVVFPNGKFDDVPDTMAMALSRLEERHTITDINFGVNNRLTRVNPLYRRGF
jgi:predicted phage terminase large subunit-like protein